MVEHCIQPQNAACAVRTVALEQDAVYRSIALYRRPGELQRALAEALNGPVPLHAKLTHTYYNPFSRARLVAEVTMPGEREPQLLSLKIFSTKDRAAAVYARAVAKQAPSTSGPAVMRLRDGHTVVWWLPNGQNLKKIAVCFDQARFRRFIAKQNLSIREDEASLPRLLRYVPRRRAVFRWHSAIHGRVYFKFYALKRPSSAENLRKLNEIGPALGLRVPRMLAHDKECNVVTMDEVPGIPLTELLPVAGPRDLHRVGVALARLHSAPLEPDIVWTVESEVEVLRSAANELAEALPESAPALLSLCGRLALIRPAPSAQVPIHANLFGDQILVGNAAIGIVDWDDLALGDPLFDTGRLAAHLIYMALCGSIPAQTATAHIEALLEGYAQVRGTPDPQTLRWHAAVALLLRAKISALRPLASEWGARVDDSIEAAQHVLEGRWLP